MSYRLWSSFKILDIAVFQFALEEPEQLSGFFLKKKPHFTKSEAPRELENSSRHRARTADTLSLKVFPYQFRTRLQGVD